MSTFGLDRNYEQFNFEEVSVEELQLISGGSGSAFGGLSLKEGGLALVGIGVAAVLAPAVTIGIGAFAISAGVTMLVGSAAYG